MSGQSLGLIETVGLAVAVEAADAAMKSANVELAGYELTNGGGLVTVKLTGEVGAINAAVAAGVAAAGRIGNVYAWKVIARTSTCIDKLIVSQKTYGVPPVQPIEPQSGVATFATEPNAMAIPVVTPEEFPGMTGCSDVQNEPMQRPAAKEQKPESDTVGVKGDVQQDKKSLRARGKTTRR